MPQLPKRWWYTAKKKPRYVNDEAWRVALEMRTKVRAVEQRLKAGVTPAEETNLRHELTDYVIQMSSVVARSRVEGGRRKKPRDDSRPH